MAENARASSEPCRCYLYGYRAGLADVVADLHEASVGDATRAQALAGLLAKATRERTLGRQIYQRMPLHRTVCTNKRAGMFLGSDR